ncbi:l-type lectin-domain containing receptor kinase ix.1 [Quercus suber]|uniref:L-type lectin-domain containing receptor kinase ix.1 n=1 Tax=Quercus suber TaxID=58331 RepID=A0AAW0IWD0_QUESU
MNKVNFLCRVGWATYFERVPLWDYSENLSADFTARSPNYGHGLAFFLAPVGLEIPPNSVGGFLGLFNTTNSDSSQNQIVHVEFDSFVNQEWDPTVQHLGDFELARFMDHELGPQTIEVFGTLGYMAPKYLRMGKASKESDVYSFGLVSLEIVTGRRSINPMGKDFEMGLVDWIWNLHGKGDLLLALDKKLQTNFDEKQVECLMIIGLWCSHLDQNLRPSIRQAIQVLNFEATMPNLPTDMPVPTPARISFCEASLSTTSL